MSQGRSFTDVVRPRTWRAEDVHEDAQTDATREVLIHHGRPDPRDDLDYWHLLTAADADPSVDLGEVYGELDDIRREIDHKAALSHPEFWGRVDELTRAGIISALRDWSVAWRRWQESLAAARERYDDRRRALSALVEERGVPDTTDDLPPPAHVTLPIRAHRAPLGLPIILGKVA